MVLSSGLVYKPMPNILNDSRVVNKLETSFTDDARVIIYDRHLFIVQATHLSSFLPRLESSYANNLINTVCGATKGWNQTVDLHT